MIGINENGDEVAYTIVKQIIEKLALLTIKKHWTKNYKISIFKAFFALYFLVSVESTSSSSAYLENSLQFSYPFPEPVCYYANWN